MPVDTRARVPARSRPLRLAIVDDDEIIVEGLRAMLARHRDQVEVVGRLPITEDLLTAATALKPEVVMVGVHPRGTPVLEVAARLMAGEPEFKVVIFTDDVDERRASESLRLGASGYLLRSLGGDELVSYLMGIGRGEVVLDPTVAAGIALRAARGADNESWPGSELGLTQRESEVLSLLVNGGSNRAIATELVLGQETVKTHLRSIYKKLGVKDRAQAVATVLRQGIIT